MIENTLTTIAIASMQDNPFDADRRGILADILEENDRIWEAVALRAGRVPLTEFDKIAAVQLGNCRFCPGTFDKRFAQRIFNSADDEQSSLTPRSYLWMWVLLHRYRKSVKNARVKIMAENRYNLYIELLGVKHLKPIIRRLTTTTFLDCRKLNNDLEV